MSSMTTTIESNPVRIDSLSKPLQDKFITLKDLIINRESIKNHQQDIERQLDSFKNRIIRNISIVLLASFVISYFIMWWSNSDLVFFTVVLVELQFMIIFASFVPQLTKVERYKSYQRIINNQKKIKDLYGITDQILLCMRAVLDKKDQRKIRINYKAHNRRHSELIKRIRYFQQHDIHEVKELLNRISNPIGIDGLYSEYGKQEIYQFIISDLISIILYETLNSKELRNLKSDIISRSTIEYDGKYLDERPEWTKKYTLPVKYQR